jgi:hypothetical protein
LAKDDEAPIKRHRFGVETGVNGLIKELYAMKEAGVNHIGLHFRRNTHAVDTAMQRIAQHVFPRFHDK